jgi:protein SCO1
LRTHIRTTIAATLVCVAGLAVANAATDGFQAYTLESARRLNALRSPAPLPDLDLDLVDTGRTRLSNVPAQVLIVDFIYTRCPTYCAALGSVYAQLRERLAAEIAAGTVRLVSISFDPTHDGRAELRAYRTRYGQDGAGWHIGAPAEPAELPIWLSTFGVVVIPDEFGGYAHNAALHVVGPERTLVRIHDLDDMDGAVRTVRQVIAGTPGNVALR